MSQKAGEPPDPEKAAKLEARRKAYALKVWKADPKTQAQQQELDAARAQLQRLQDGTAHSRVSCTGPIGRSTEFQGVPEAQNGVFGGFRGSKNST